MKFRTQSDHDLIHEDSYTVLEDYCDLEPEPTDLPNPKKLLSKKIRTKLKQYAAKKSKALPKKDP